MAYGRHNRYYKHKAAWDRERVSRTPPERIKRAMDVLDARLDADGWGSRTIRTHEDTYNPEMAK